MGYKHIVMDAETEALFNSLKNHFEIEKEVSLSDKETLTVICKELMKVIA
jgi:hypothetical protein